MKFIISLIFCQSLSENLARLSSLWYNVESLYKSFTVLSIKLRLALSLFSEYTFHAVKSGVPSGFMKSFSVKENLSLTIPRSQLIGPQKYRSLEQIHFCWTHHGNPYSKDINPGITAALDVCRIQWENDKHYIIFPTERGWRKVHFRVNYAPIEGSLFICPANAYPNIFHIKIYMDDQETPQLDIRKIKLHFWNRKKELLN